MRIIVFGASGQTGKEVIKLMASAGHEVIGAMRDVSKTSTQDNLTTVACDVLDPSSLTFATQAKADAVVIVLGTKQLTGNQVRSLGTSNIISALRPIEGKKPRIILLSAAGVGSSWGQIGWFSQLLSRLILGHTMREHETQEQTLINSGFQHHILRAVGLTNKPQTGYQLMRKHKLPNMYVSRKAVAVSIADLIVKETDQSSINCICSD